MSELSKSTWIPWTTSSTPPINNLTTIILCTIGAGLVVIGSVVFVYYKNKSKKTYPISGIQNTGVSCYLNAVIQMLASSEILLKEINQMKQKSDQLNLFIDILNDVNAENVKDIHKRLNCLVNQTGWQKRNQQDVFDLLSNLINGIENSLRNQILPIKLKLISSYLNNFATQPKEQDYLGLSLNLCGDYSKIPGVRIEDMIGNHFQPAMIDNDPNMEIQYYWFNNLPSVLLIHVQANIYDFDRHRMKKPEYYIQYEENLEFNYDIKNRDGSITHSRNSAVYKLVGLVKHRGSISGGHYTCYRMYNDQWYYVNDELVKPIMSNSCINKMNHTIGPNSPYLFLYDKMDIKN